MQLEETLGIRLFERRHRGVQITEAGRHFLAEVKAGLEQLDHAVKSAGCIASGEVGQLRISVPTTITAGFLADLLKNYREQWPNIEVEIVDGRADDAITQIRDGKLDVAFVVGAPDLPDCHCRQFWSEALLAALPESDARARVDTLCWQDVAGDQFLVRQDGTGPQIHDRITRHFNERGCAARVKRCNVERCMLFSMVAQGYGITLCGEAVSKLAFPGVTCVPLSDEPEPFKFSAVWSPHNTSKALRTLIAMAHKMSAKLHNPGDNEASA
jgi:DNA-binding transcriptional LysR family regulator